MANRNPKQSLDGRVTRAAEAALVRRKSVTAIDVLCGMGLLEVAKLELWRKGQVEYLERVIRGSLSRISSAMASFRRWAREKGLKPSETVYLRKASGRKQPLRFSKSGDPAIEKNYRTHYVAPAAPERKPKAPAKRPVRTDRLVIHKLVSAEDCSECGAEMEEGDLLAKEGEMLLCLACAGLDDLEFLPAGDLALTRRTAKYSKRTAVVVRFSQTRKRYERQGILAELDAIYKAEQECLEDAGERASARVRAAARRREEDRRLTIQMAKKITVLFPGCPTPEAIAQHTARRGSGRVGRTEAGRNLREEALTAAVVAAIRHQHTGYDELLARGVDRETARRKVQDKIDNVLEQWRRGRKPTVRRPRA
jgi:hypothetical protein